MTKQASIAYISDLIENPARITEADHSSIAGLRQSFPYFVPARYLEAYHKHQAAPYAPAMMSAVMPYVGNWVLFCDFLNAGTAIFPRGRKAGAPADAQANDRPILKPQTVIVEPKVAAKTEQPEQESDAPVITAEEPGAEPVVEMVEDIVAATPEVEPLVTEVAEETSNIVIAEPASVEEPEPVAEVTEQGAVAAMDSEMTTAEEERVVVEATLKGEAIQEVPDDVKEAFALMAGEIEEDVVPAQAEGVAEGADGDVAHEMPAETATTVPAPVVEETIDKEALEELENRHNNFWTQGEEEIEKQTEGDVSEEQGSDTGAQNVATDAVEETEEQVEEYIEVEEIEELPPYVPRRNEKPLIYPVYTEDYFLQQGEKISAEMPDELDSLRSEDAATSLMVQMSFSEWLHHFKSTTERQKEENRDQKALKTMWQKEKLAAAIEEENEEIPENVFEMAVNSITKEDGLASESLAEIYIKQGKLDKAVDMYRKLSLRNPQKNAYFARKIEDILKEKGT